MPISDKAIVSTSQAELIYKIRHGFPVDLGQRIYDQLLFFSRDDNKINALGIPFPILIYQLLLSQGFQRKDYVESEEPLAASMRIDNRFFGDEQFNDLAESPVQDAAQDRSLINHSEDDGGRALEVSQLDDENPWLFQTLS